MTVATPPRLRWERLPAHIRAAAQDALGARVVGEHSQAGGFSPGLASRLELADGRRVFAKAINAERNPHAPGLYRREAAIMATLPVEVPAPRLRWTYDDGDWIMLVLDDVDGRMPDEPWNPADLRRVVAALAQLAVQLTPSPVTSVPSVVDDLAENFQSWRTLAGQPELAARLGPWARANLGELSELESHWSHAARGDTLMHADLRADNVLLTSDRVVFVDWPYAVTGASWLDLLFFLPSAAAPGTVDPAAIWRDYPPAQGAAPDAVNAVLAAVAGDFLYQSLQPPPVNLPTLRAHQRAKGRAALEWLRSRIA